MNMVDDVVRELVAMFAGDARLSAAVLALLGLIAILVHLGLKPIAGGIMLLVGCLALLLESVLRRSRAARPPS